MTENPEALPSQESALKEREQREIQLVQLWLQGKEKTPQDCVAYHATSLETLDIILATGNIPGVTEIRHAKDSPFKPQLGDVYFFPIGTHFPFETIIDDRGSWQQELPFYQSMTEEEARPDGYAEGIAQSHRLLTLLGQPLNKNAGRANALIDNFYEPEDYPDRQQAYPIFRAMVESDEALQKAVEDARQRKGVVLGIKRDTFLKYPPHFSGEDMRFHPQEPILNLLSLARDAGEETPEGKFFTGLYQKHEAKLGK